MPNDRRDTALVGRHNNRRPQSVAGRQQTAAVVLSAGETPSPSCLLYRPSMPLGPTPCPKACTTAPPPRRFRRSSISTWKRSPRCGRRLATAVTDKAASTTWVQPGGGAWPWQIEGPRHARYRALRVAPVPPKTADLTRPSAAAGGMTGRDEGTGALIEPRNKWGNAFCLAVTIVRRLQSDTQWWVRLIRPHTQKFGHSPNPSAKPASKYTPLL